MLIDNKRNYYPEAGLNLPTVWDFIQKNNGKETGQTGRLNIVTGFFARLQHKIAQN